MDADKAIFQTWIDGYKVETNGSIVGYGQAPFAERTIVRTGKQSMPFFYDNSGGAATAEATRTFDRAQDWTQYGSQTLSLAFYGDPNNTGTMYLKINNTKVPYNGDAADIKQAEWQPVEYRSGLDRRQPHERHEAGDRRRGRRGGGHAVLR